MPEIFNRTEISAAPDLVYRIARDVERFPEFMPDVKSVEIRERSNDGRRQVVDWVGWMPEFRLTVRWTEEDRWDDVARRCDFRLVRGDFKEYDGSWLFLPCREGTVFESIVRYEIEIPLVGPLIRGVIKKKMHENVQRLQEAVKRRAEEGPGDAGSWADGRGCES
jgi:coenzyme Q-binding protein COQ10